LRSVDNRRPDIVCFVNGIPLVVIEAKRPDSQAKKGPTINEGISQSLRNQRPDEIPHLFAYSQLPFLRLAIWSFCFDYYQRNTIYKANDIRSSIIYTTISQSLRNQRPDEIPHLFAYSQLLLSINGHEGRYGGPFFAWLSGRFASITTKGIPFTKQTISGLRLSTQSLRNQRPDEIPHLFAYSQLLLSINGHEGRYGTCSLGYLVVLLRLLPKEYHLQSKRYQVFDYLHHLSANHQRRDIPIFTQSAS
jgi:type I site-specific restriction-modification system R (restriction) subunit